MIELFDNYGKLVSLSYNYDIITGKFIVSNIHPNYKFSQWVKDQSIDMAVDSELFYIKKYRELPGPYLLVYIGINGIMGTSVCFEFSDPNHEILFKLTHL